MLSGAMLMTRKWSLVMAGVDLLLAVLYFLNASQFMRIDGCLDAGGRWNYELRRCEIAR